MSQKQPPIPGRSSSEANVGCVALTRDVVSGLQVCVSSVELLQGMDLPLEANLPLARLARAVDALVAAAAAARWPAGAIEASISVGKRAGRG